MAFSSREAIYYDLFCAGDNYAAEATELRSRYPDAHTVLEVGAGTGLLTQELVSRGFRVTALEPAAGMRDRLVVRQLPHLVVLPDTVQKYLQSQPPQYDIVVAHCDVLNYIPNGEIYRVMQGLRAISRQPVSFKIWLPERGIWPFRYRRRGRASQIRLALRWKNTVHVLFLFWGFGPVRQYHQIYLHDPSQLHALNG